MIDQADELLADVQDSDELDIEVRASMVSLLDQVYELLQETERYVPG